MDDLIDEGITDDRRGKKILRRYTSVNLIRFAEIIAETSAYRISVWINICFPLIFKLPLGGPIFVGHYSFYEKLRVRRTVENAVLHIDERQTVLTVGSLSAAKFTL